MGYVDSNLGSGEQVVHRGELHWAIFLPGIVLLPILIAHFPQVRGEISAPTPGVTTRTRHGLLVPRIAKGARPRRQSRHRLEVSYPRRRLARA